jgi:serine/threonine protein kinase
MVGVQDRLQRRASGGSSRRGILMQAQYEILKIAGAGNFGTLCVARHTVNGERLAVKVLHKAHRGDTKVLQRARDEARMLHRLDHPNIVRVHRLFEHEERPIIVMEYVEGSSVEQLVRLSTKAIPTSIALAVAMQSASALHAAYSEPLGPNRVPMRIVHRDIKPSNILMSLTGEVKLVDFGVARAEFVGREVQTVAIPRGSMGYNSPEQRMGLSSNSPAIDVFSLGMTLVYMLTGKVMVLPLKVSSFGEALQRQAAYIAPDDISPDQRLKLLELICLMCAFEPEKRPTMAQVIESVAALLGAEGLEGLDRSMAAFGDDWVQAVARQQFDTHPEDHPQYHDVCFLETLCEDVPDVISLTPARLGPDLVEAFIALEGWEHRVEELEEFIENMAEWPKEPFVQILARAGRPWWQIWQPKIPPAKIVAALKILNRSPSKESQKLAGRLRGHGDFSVADAARSHLAFGWKIHS